MAGEASVLDGVNRLIDATCAQRSTSVRPAMKTDFKVDRPVPGLTDLCLLVRDSLDDVVAALRKRHVDCLGPRSAGLARLGLLPRYTSGILTGI